jgi:hypothetical protein
VFAFRTIVRLTPKEFLNDFGSKVSFVNCSGEEIIIKAEWLVEKVLAISAKYAVGVSY